MTAPLARSRVIAGAPDGASSPEPVLLDTGTPYAVSSVAGLTTTGADMAGMLVTAHFSDGSVASSRWRPGPGPLYGVEVGGLQIWVDAAGDTSNSRWLVWFSGGPRVRRLVFEGAPAGVVFEVGGGSSPDARPFEWFPDDLCGTAATYRNVVAVGGAGPVGGLYETLELRFARPLGELGEGPVGIFLADTARVAGGRFVAAPQPERAEAGATEPDGVGAVVRGRRVA